MDNPWFGRAEPAPRAAHRLFCLPYAGGSATAYREWHALAPGGIQVCPVELPGRGRRFGEPPLARMRPLADALAGAVAPFLDRPFAVFGHSMGGLLGFELVRTLRRRQLPLPAHLFVSAIAAPGAPRTRPPVHRATDAEVVDELRLLGGTPPELLDDEELMALMVPMIRADFSVLETYEYRPEPPLPVPLTVFGGTDDPLVPVRSLQGWRRQSAAGARLRVLTGGHFYVHPAAADIMAAIAATLATAAPEPAPNAPVPVLVQRQPLPETGSDSALSTLRRGEGTGLAELEPLSGPAAEAELQELLDAESSPRAPGAWQAPPAGTDDQEKGA